MPAVRALQGKPSHEEQETAVGQREYRAGDVSPDGKQLAFVAQNNKLQLWTIANGRSKTLSIGANYATVAAAPAWQP